MHILRATASFSLLGVLACTKPNPYGDEVASPDTDTGAESGTTSGTESGDGDGDPSTTTESTDSTESGGDMGELIGQFVLTYYWFLIEDDYDGPDTTVLVDVACSPIANVPEEFAAAICVEGSGRLTSGEVLNYADTCACGFQCGDGPMVCFALLDPVQFPWGSGSTDNPLEPLRSWAVDEAEIPHGTIVYAPAWDGVEIPALDGIGGFTHDGCFRADDVGGGIDGLHIDFFAGTTAMWTALEALFPSLEQEFAVYQNSPACADFGG